MKRFIILHCLLVIVSGIIYAQGDSLRTDSAYVEPKLAVSSLTKSAADSAYIQEDYVTAIAIYEDILASQGESASIYYNLGNSYYKNNNIAKAVLNLERALLLNPGDSDIRFNLELARSKTVDKVTPLREVFFVTWFHDIKNCMSTDAWAIVAITSFLVFIISIVLYLFGKKMVIKKIGFVIAICSFVSVLVTNVFAYSQKKALTERGNAIVMVPSVTAKSTPNEGGTDLFILHEGHKVNIKDASMKEWVEIQLEDGNVGWIPFSVIEII